MSVYEEKESYAASRAGGIGGTDCAAILGLSPYRRPIDIYAGKVNPEGQPELDKECLTWGTLLEPVVRQRYAAKFSVNVIEPAFIGNYFPKSRPWNDSTLVIGSEDWMLGAPDGWLPGHDAGLEVKCSARRSGEWGDEGSDEVPAHYLVQVAWYMAVTNANSWNFAVLFSGNTLQQFHVKRDAQLERDMIEAARSFWFDNVVKQVEPPIDESESYGRYLARKFSLSTGAVIKNPPQDILDWTTAMKLADDEVKAAEDRKREANNHLRLLIGDAQKALTPLGSVGWVRPEKKLETDWEKAFATLAERTHAPEVLRGMTIDDCSGTIQREPYLRAWWKR